MKTISQLLVVVLTIVLVGFVLENRNNGRLGVATMESILGVAVIVLSSQQQRACSKLQQLSRVATTTSALGVAVVGLCLVTWSCSTKSALGVAAVGSCPELQQQKVDAWSCNREVLQPL
jgi:ABC-type transport system involved in cytochrome c biogenesis permease subunit